MVHSHRAPHNRNIWSSRLADSFVCFGGGSIPTTYGLPNYGKSSNTSQVSNTKSGSRIYAEGPTNCAIRVAWGFYSWFCGKLKLLLWAVSVNPFPVTQFLSASRLKLWKI